MLLISPNLVATGPVRQRFASRIAVGCALGILATLAIDVVRLATAGGPVMLEWKRIRFIVILGFALIGAFFLGHYVARSSTRTRLLLAPTERLLVMIWMLLPISIVSVIVLLIRNH